MTILIIEQQFKQTDSEYTHTHYRHRVPRRRVSKHNAETLNRSHPFSCSVGRSSTAFTVELPIFDCAMRHALSPILSKEHYISCLQIQRFECERAFTQTTQTSARSFRYSRCIQNGKVKSENTIA